jgi:hypothetical protein
MENEGSSKSCSKCGEENPSDAWCCNVCGCSLTNEKSVVKIGDLPTASFLFALCGLVLLAPSLFAVSVPRVLSPRLKWVGITFLLSLIVLAASLILGLLGIIQVERSGGRTTGRLFAVGAVLIAVFGGLLPAWSIVLRFHRSTAFRMVCGTNLSRIGKAMLIYGNDHDDKLPRAAGQSGVWAAKIADWKGANRFEAYDINPDGTGGRASISSSLYLLVKYAEVEPKHFICTGDSGIKEFKLGWFKARGKKLTDLWDFGPEPPRHCSYSYHMPYSKYGLTTTDDPALAVAAERNPWMDSPFRKARDFQVFDPNGGRLGIRAGNAITHKADGQNVLFLDNHVGFEKQSFCGINEDNIYTYWEGGDIRRGTPPKLGSQPADRWDSLLVNDPPVPR